MHMRDAGQRGGWLVRSGMRRMCGHGYPFPGKPKIACDLERVTLPNLDVDADEGVLRGLDPRCRLGTICKCRTTSHLSRFKCAPHILVSPSRI
jgi:hypothetical protein